jgi:YVTN family beta-propeller protein
LKKEIMQSRYLVVAVIFGCEIAATCTGFTSSVHAATISTNVFTLPVGDSSASVVNGVIFDGQNIWAAIQNPSGGVVKRLDRTGRVLSATAVGSAPLEMAFDGKNVWVADYTSSDLMVVNSSGTVLSTISMPGANPEGLVFDGTYIWSANNGVGANSVSKFNATTRTLVATYPAGRNPDGVAYDGSRLWVTNSYSNNVWVLNPNTGAQLAAYGTGIFPLSIIFDGTNMWVGNGTGVDVGAMILGFGSVSKIRASDGASMGTFTVGNHVRGLTYDGTSIWVCNGKDNTISQLRAKNVVLLGTYNTGKLPRAVAYDGSKVWVANSGDNTLTVIQPASGLVEASSGSVGSPVSGITPVAVKSRAVAPPKTLQSMIGVLFDDN